MTNWIKYFGQVIDKQRQWKNSRIRFSVSSTGKWPPTFAWCSTSFLSAYFWLDSYAAVAARSAVRMITVGAKVKTSKTKNQHQFQLRNKNLANHYLQPKEISLKVVMTLKRRDKTLRKVSISVKLKPSVISQESKMKKQRKEGPW